MLSHSLWQRHFGGDPALLGQTVTLGGEAHTVIGVIPEDFQADPAADVWLPLQAEPASTDGAHRFAVYARLRPGVSLAAAEAQMRIIHDEYRRLHPRTVDPHEYPKVVSLQDFRVGDIRTTLLLFAGAVGFVLLIACANVANLLLARAAARRRELAVRVALGAGRGRILRQLLTESMVLSVLGGACGLLLAIWSIRPLLSLAPVSLPEVSPGSLQLNMSVLVFALVLSGVSGLVFGLFPALQAIRSDLQPDLKDGSPAAGAGRRQARMRNLLVTAELALALVLLTGAGLLVRTLIALRSVDTGFDPRNVVTVKAPLTGRNYGSTQAVMTSVDRTLARLEIMPGITAAAMASQLPLEGGFETMFTIEGRQQENGPYHGGAAVRAIAGQYFDVFRIPLRQGRAFTAQDRAGTPPVVIVNEALAKRFWTGQDSLGQRVAFGRGLGAFADTTREVVGVVRSVREAGLTGADQPVVYIPYAQLNDRLATAVNQLFPVAFAVRTAADPNRLATPVEHAVQTAHPNLTIRPAMTMRQVAGAATSRQSFSMFLLASFAAVALLLAAIGTYGVVSYGVEQRRREMGIRVALGAGKSDVLRLVAGHGMRMAGAGVVLGLLASFGLTRLLASFLYGVEAHDPATFAAVAAILCGVALIASYLPARRAAKIDPIEALRHE